MGNGEMGNGKVDRHQMSFMLSAVSRELSGNKLSSVLDETSPMFIGLTSLSHLVLAANHIQSVSRHAFDGLDSLYHLDLTSNEVSSIQDDTFTHLSNLHTVLVCLSV